MAMTRVDNIVNNKMSLEESRELLSLLKKSGCVQLGYGVEEVDEERLLAIRKGNSLDDTYLGLA